jgi:UDP-2-acetamido-3-amino-2,3-dideoxy-glucuronate N-acetyltransferase
MTSVETFNAIAPDVKLGKDVRLSKFINMYGCEIGDSSKVGAFVEIQRGAKVGSRCKISSHTFICEGVAIGDECFIGHSVVFINDKTPRAVNSEGELETPEDWSDRFVTTIVGKRVSIGSNATIMGGIEIGDNAIIGAGSVVTKNVPAGEIWIGNPAKFLKRM